MDRQESSAPYIWVSFDFRNQDPVIPLLERMRQEGLPVQWKNGEMKWEDITSCIKESDQVIIFLSEAYLNFKHFNIHNLIVPLIIMIIYIFIECFVLIKRMKKVLF